jgi:hypothetical protein
MTDAFTAEATKASALILLGAYEQPHFGLVNVHLYIDLSFNVVSTSHNPSGFSQPA